MQFTQRKSAEKAAEGTFNKLLIKGNKITIRLGSWLSPISVMEYIHFRWGKSQGKTAGPSDTGVGQVHE